MSFTFDGSKTTTSAIIPGRSKPRSVRSKPAGGAAGDLPHRLLDGEELLVAA
jgi:hypothetical protein